MLQAGCDLLASSCCRMCHRRHFIHPCIISIILITMNTCFSSEQLNLRLDLHVQYSQEWTRRSSMDSRNRSTSWRHELLELILSNALQDPLLIINNDSTAVDAVDDVDGSTTSRSQWAGRFDFLMSMIAYCVGLGGLRVQQGVHCCRQCVALPVFVLQERWR